MNFTLLRCAECGAYLPAEPLADRDGSRLFGCCACGYATVELSFPEIAVAFPPGFDGTTDATGLGRPAVSFSCS